MSIKILQAQAESINSDLLSAKRELHAPKSNLSLNEKSVNSANDLLKDAKNNHKNQIKFYEEDKKRYKVLKKYGEVLQLVEKLLGLMPSNLDNLSLEELEEKLEELLKTRKKNELQMSFIFYQNIITDLLSNLLTIEKDFQAGKISSSQAYEHVQTSKEQIKEHANDMPEILRPTLEETSYLVKLYENSYSQELTDNSSLNEASDLRTTEVQLKHEILFDKLNSDTKNMISKVGSLSTDLSKFEPQVNLDKLTDNLKSTENILKTENWDVNQMDVAVGELQRTTLSLTDQQVDLNNQNENLVERINDCTKSTTEMISVSTRDFSRETFIDASKRADQSKTNTEEIKDILENDENFSTTIGSQTANSIIAQLDADEEFTDRIAIDPNADTSAKENLSFENAQDVVNALKDDVLSLEEKREILLKLELQKETIDDDKKE